MGDLNRMWKKAITLTMTAALLLQSGTVSAEEAELQQWLELTAPVLETEAGTAVSANLKIGDWLDYSDYGMEREDVIGGTYSFGLTTKDANDNVINDDQLAYCVQSYFMTPLPGDHSAEMIDQVSSIGGQKNLHKVFYYGYGGAAYDAAEFEAVLKETNSEYFENVYEKLSEEEKEELAYILTHSASTYAYFNDGTDLEDYFALQFQVKYGDDWEKQYGYFKDIELSAAGIEDGDMNLYGSTYGMTTTGIEMAKKWYQVLTSKEEPALCVEESDGVFTFVGNERNDGLKMEFAVPDDFTCELFCVNGDSELAEAAEAVTVCPGDSFTFTYVGESVSTEKDGISDLNVEVAGTLSGTEKEAWNLVILETNKGNAQAVSRRQQDIAAVSMSDAGRTSLEFGIGLQKGNIELVLADEVQQAVSGAVLGVYYDEACTTPVMQDGKAVELVTDEDGKAYLEYVVNDKLEENGNKLYAKELSAPEWNALDESVYCLEAGVSQAVTNERVFEAAEVAITCQVHLTGRAMKDGEYTFDLIQVTDATGETVVEGGASGTATNDADGNVVFEGITVDEPGTYYYKVMAEDGSFIAVAEVTVDEDHKGQLIVSVTYPEGQPSFEKVYEASGETRIQGIQVTMDNGELKEGEFTFELKDAEGNVLQTASNDAEGNVEFEDMSFTQEDIGKEYVYTISLVGEQEDTEDVTVIVKVEDSPYSDGTLQITQEAGSEEEDFAFSVERAYEDLEATLEGIQVQVADGELAGGEFTFELKDAEGNVVATGTNDAEGNVVFEGITYTQDDYGKEYEYTVSMVTDETVTTDTEPAVIKVKVGDTDGILSITQETVGEVFQSSIAEPESETETVSETETETVSETVSETETETVSETASETETETASETAKDTETETASETAKDTETETASETAKDTETETASETETEAAEEGNGYVLPISISIIILLILFIIGWYRRNKSKK